MSAAATPGLQKEVESLGCHFFKKPFRISEIRVWLEECVARVPHERTLENFG
jgi:hypothetical protein